MHRISLSTRTDREAVFSDRISLSNHTDREAVFSDRINLSILDMTERERLNPVAARSQDRQHSALAPDFAEMIDHPSIVSFLRARFCKNETLSFN